MHHIISLLPSDTNLEILAEYCKHGRFNLIKVKNPVELLEKVNTLRPSIVLISKELSAPESETILSDIRAYSFHTKTMLFLRDFSVAQRLKFFKQGADDLLEYPFHPRETFFRIQRLLRFQRVFESHQYHLGDNIIYHSTNSTLELRDESIPLRRREGQVLACLAEHKNVVVSREQIARWIWGDTSLAALGTVDVYVKRLRRSLAGKAYLIKTVRGLGYLLVVEPESSE